MRRLIRPPSRPFKLATVTIVVSCVAVPVSRVWMPHRAESSSHFLSIVFAALTISIMVMLASAASDKLKVRAVLVSGVALIVLGVAVGLQYLGGDWWQTVPFFVTTLVGLALTLAQDWIAPPADACKSPCIPHAVDANRGGHVKPECSGRDSRHAGAGIEDRGFADGELMTHEEGSIGDLPEPDASGKPR